ncbi:MAG: alanine racemase [Coleofasciculaceae cyanobacterium SM2_1_6]|nr:alanine racemase [Coleofasciculaceae cyanobacterium SM2_1_6]
MSPDVFPQIPPTPIPVLDPALRAWLEIDSAALLHNLQQLQGLLSPGCELMAVVKADAYGHGAWGIAATILAQGVESLAVATISEGVELRQAGIKAPILILGSIATPEAAQVILHHHLEPTLSSYSQAQLFSEIVTNTGTNTGINLEINQGTNSQQFCSRPTLPVHINVDTGMSRLGAPWLQARELVQQVQALPGLEIASIYSHLATADELDPTVRELQHDRFQQVIQSCQDLGLSPRVKFHLANSAGTLVDPELHYDRVRIGLALYGLPPAPHLRSKASLQPVMAVKARVTLVKSLTAGTGVSYGYSFIAPKDMAIAVVGIGYADGVPRLLSNQMQVIIRGQRVAQIGKVTMDQLMIDVSAIPDVQPGEIVTLIGADGKEKITAEDWAEAIDTISWEILCGFKSRLPRLTLA